MKTPKNFGRVTQLAIGILLLYMAFNSANNLESELLEEDGYGNLGFLILAVVYFSMGIGSLMSTAIINKCGTKFSLFIGGLGCMIHIMITTLPGL